MDYILSLNKGENMSRQTLNQVHVELITRLLRSQIEVLTNLVTHIEEGNDIDGYVKDNLKRTEKDLRWLRKFYLNHS